MTDELPPLPEPRELILKLAREHGTAYTSRHYPDDPAFAFPTSKLLAFARAIEAAALAQKAEPDEQEAALQKIADFGQDQEPEPVPCCGKYETCSHACTPRGKWLGRREAERAALAGQPVNQWISVAEHLPTNNKEYVHDLMVSNEYGNVDICSYDGYAKYFDVGQSSRLGGHPITHWAPGPLSPSQPAAVPLTDEQIHMIADRLWEQGYIQALSKDTARIYARAVLAAAAGEKP